MEFGRVGGPHVAGQLRHDQQPARLDGRPSVVRRGRRGRQPVRVPILRQDVSPRQLPEETRTGGYAVGFILFIFFFRPGNFIAIVILVLITAVVLPLPREMGARDVGRVSRPGGNLSFGVCSRALRIFRFSRTRVERRRTLYIITRTFSLGSGTYLCLPVVLRVIASLE